MKRNASIATPQFNQDGSVKNMFRQTGTVDTETFIFTPAANSGGHIVHLHKEENLKQAEEAFTNNSKTW